MREYWARQAPRPLSGPHPTLEETVATRDFLARRVYMRPQYTSSGRTLSRGTNPDGECLVARAGQTLVPAAPERRLTVDAYSPPCPTARAAAAASLGC